MRFINSDVEVKTSRRSLNCLHTTCLHGRPQWCFNLHSFVSVFVPVTALAVLGPAVVRIISLIRIFDKTRSKTPITTTIKVKTYSYSLQAASYNTCSLQPITAYRPVDGISPLTAWVSTARWLNAALRTGITDVKVKSVSEYLLYRATYRVDSNSSALQSEKWQLIGMS